jgi:hypothetical protein
MHTPCFVHFLHHHHSPNQGGSSADDLGKRGVEGAAVFVACRGGVISFMYLGGGWIIAVLVVQLVHVSIWCCEVYVSICLSFVCESISYLLSSGLFFVDFI